MLRLRARSKFASQTLHQLLRAHGVKNAVCTQHQELVALRDIHGLNVGPRRHHLALPRQARRTFVREVAQGSAQVEAARAATLQLDAPLHAHSAARGLNAGSLLLVVRLVIARKVHGRTSSAQHCAAVATVRAESAEPAIGHAEHESNSGGRSNEVEGMGVLLQRVAKAIICNGKGTVESQCWVMSCSELRGHNGRQVPRHKLSNLLSAMSIEDSKEGCSCVACLPNVSTAAPED
mmetsp:Transcript_8957/g.26335  ORF Transcript_8957/g.26335 Transcript_8957/m.26335 type:complete len:235 (-) Transcript_8957:900-1604(-)